MEFEKIFVIGFNKTGTSTFHVLFQKNGLMSQHDGSKWDIENYQCFSDNGNFRDWKRLFRDYPDCIFVLNTRPVDAWIRSRAKHCYVEKLPWGYPPEKQLYKGWILERNKHYAEVIQFFFNDPDKLVIVDISRPQWLHFVCAQLKLTLFDLNVNKGSDLVPSSHMTEVNAAMHTAMDALSIDKAEYSSPFLINSMLSEMELAEYEQLLSLYANNL